jgi:hypothetical protein
MWRGRWVQRGMRGAREARTARRTAGAPHRHRAPDLRLTLPSCLCTRTPRALHRSPWPRATGNSGGPVQTAARLWSAARVDVGAGGAEHAAHRLAGPPTAMPRIACGFSRGCMLALGALLCVEPARNVRSRRQARCCWQRQRRRVWRPRDAPPARRRRPLADPAASAHRSRRPRAAPLPRTSSRALSSLTQMQLKPPAAHSTPRDQRPAMKGLRTRRKKKVRHAAHRGMTSRVRVARDALRRDAPLTAPSTELAHR